MSSIKTAPTPEKVALLKGGWNSERAVSLSSAKGICPALKASGFEVLEIDVTRDIQTLIKQLTDFAPDVVFLNALHGRYVEDGMMQGLMEMLGYPYTGSDVISSALAFDKAQSRSLFKANGIPIPKGQTFIAKEFFKEPLAGFDYPFVAKPLNEGSSVGVFIIHTPEAFKQAADHWTFGKTVLVEEYIPGREFSVTVMDGNPLGILELRAKEGFYDYDAKCTDGLTDHIIPTDLSEKDYEQTLDVARKAVASLGVSGVTRVDIRFDTSRPEGARAVVLEVNTLPGMTSLSIAPETAAHAGITYEQLCKWMVKNPIWPQENPLLKEPLKDGEKRAL